MDCTLFTEFFTAGARTFLDAALDLALAEDGADLTSQGIFSREARAHALITAKETSLVAGLPLIPLIMTSRSQFALPLTMKTVKSISILAEFFWRPFLPCKTS